MKSIKTICLCMLAAVMFTACNNVSYKKTPGGMAYKLYGGKGAAKVKAGNFIKLNFIQKIADSTYFDSHQGMPLYFRVPDKTTPYDLSEIWTLLKKGDSVVTTQLIDTFMAKNPTGNFGKLKKGDKIETFIRVIEVFANDSLSMLDEEKEKAAFATKESTVIEKYLADKKITAVKTPGGAFVETIKEGEGPAIVTGNYVSVKYTALHWDGTPFDSNVDTSFQHTEPFSVTIGQQGAIKGFEEGLTFMKKGGQGRIYIPSTLAWGAQGSPPKVKGFENVIFSIEVLDVQASAPPPPPMPPMQQPPAQQGQ